MTRSRFFGLWALSNNTIYLDKYEGWGILADTSPPPALALSATAKAMEAVFASNELSNDEKLVLSLHYGVFHSSLVGVTITSKTGKVFTYPEKEAFKSGEGWDLLTISDKLFDGGRAYASRHHTKALVKARNILQAGEGLEEYGHNSNQTNPDDVTRQSIIDLALTMSPDKPLTRQQVIDHNAAGNFPSEYTIKRLFGSVVKFKIACGFEPSRFDQAKSASNQDIVDWALRLQPDRKLTRTEIVALSKQQRFVGMSTICRRFVNLENFHRACGFGE